MGDVNARIVEAAVRERLLTPAEGQKLIAFVAKRHGDLEALLGALIRFHAVAPERAQALVAAAFAAEKASSPPTSPRAPEPVELEEVEALPEGDALAAPEELAEVVPEPEELAEVLPEPEDADAIEVADVAAPGPVRPSEPLAPPPGPTVTAAGALPAPSNTDLVLFVFPPKGELSPGAADTLARILEATVYEARLRARDPLPRLTRMGPEPLVIGAAEQLVSAGFEVLCAEAAAVLGPLEGFVVKSIRGGREIVVADRDRREATIRLGGRGLLVVGRYDTTTSTTTKVKVPTVRGKSVSLVSKDFSSEGLESAVFAHVYSELSDVPYVFTETGIADWEFLGKDKTPTARANMKALVARLASGGLTVDDRLEKHRTRVEQAASFQKQAKTTISQRSTQSAADVLSRVFYYDWKNKLASSS